MLTEPPRIGDKGIYTAAGGVVYAVKVHDVDYNVSSVVYYHEGDPLDVRRTTSLAGFMQSVSPYVPGYRVLRKQLPSLLDRLINPSKETCRNRRMLLGLPYPLEYCEECGMRIRKKLGMPARGQIGAGDV